VEMMNWLDRLERKYRRYAIPNLMSYIVGITGVVYVVAYILDLSGAFLERLELYPSEVLQGEIWRLVTYIFIPPSASPIFIAFVLYFYYIIGASLEHEWGSFRFNLYYILGMIGTTMAVLFTGGPGTSTYLNLSLFLAFAYIYPDYQILLFFILPIKVKYLAWINWFFIITTIITAPLPDKVAAIVSIINYLIFFGKDIVTGMHSRNRAYNNKRKFKSKTQVKTISHKCTVCGITPEVDPKMDFRYCPECDGLKCYCKEHIKNHEHIKKEEVMGKIIEFPKSNNE
jgi:membrane associated rhomboid family serine protease